jgi:D-alanyl-D-alanine carboxypeptidase
MGARLAGPICVTRVGQDWIDDGTLARTRSYPIGPTSIQNEKRDYFAVFLRKTQPTQQLAYNFGVSASDVSVTHVFGDLSLGGQVFWVKPKTGVKVKGSAFANTNYVVYQFRSDKEFRAPLLTPVVPRETKEFLDKTWNPPKPSFTPIPKGQTDIKNRCAYLLFFGEFEWDDADYTKVIDQDAIIIKGRWQAENITDVSIPQIARIPGGMGAVGGAIKFNKKAARQLQELWKTWEKCGFLSNVINLSGGFVARYQRQRDHSAISNHAWGSAFDINTLQNRLGYEPARLGEYGCVREMVEVAQKFGFYWGGHFRTRMDGMHFEVAQIM